MCIATFAGNYWRLGLKRMSLHESFCCKDIVELPGAYNCRGSSTRMHETSQVRKLEGVCVCVCLARRVPPQFLKKLSENAEANADLSCGFLQIGDPKDPFVLKSLRMQNPY